jgi:rubrerythrin
MKSLDIFNTALEYEIKIRDLYKEAEKIIDDPRGKSVFSALAEDEQAHVEFLEYSIDKLKNKGKIDPNKLKTSIPEAQTIIEKIDELRRVIPTRMLGDIKRALNAALKLENETTEFYLAAVEESEGEIREILLKFAEIELRHTKVVRFELDYVSNDGFWLDFPEKDMEVGW